VLSAQVLHLCGYWWSAVARVFLFPGGFMETAGRLRLADVFVSMDDPRQASKVEHDLVELLVWR
jgi:hypothetical protein